jgi:homoprotocatechuate degradation regulator HpaR
MTNKSSTARRKPKSAAPEALDMSDMSRALPIALLRARESIMAFTRPILRAHRLTDQQWRILRYAYVESPIDLTSLSEKTFIVLSSLSKICSDMEARHLIRKETAASGQRRVLISITERGKKLASAVVPMLKDRNKELDAYLSDNEFSELLRLLGKVEHLPVPRR